MDPNEFWNGFKYLFYGWLTALIAITVVLFVLYPTGPIPFWFKYVVSLTTLLGIVGGGMYGIRARRRTNQ